jgi:DNA-binding NtrC family response regulator
MVVISKYNLPTCTGIDLLELARKVDGSIPFIFFTGALENEKVAAELILTRAFGFTLKNMPILHERLRPFLKKVILNRMEQGEIRENKIVVNQIYQYIDTIRADDT